MSKGLRIHARGDFPVATVTLSGVLDVEDEAAVRNALRAMIVDQPASLIVDVSHLTLRCPAALEVLRSALRAASDMPGIPTQLLVPDGELANTMRRGGIHRDTPIVSDRTAAYLLGARQPLPRHRTIRNIPADPGVLHGVRNAAKWSCAAWDVGGLAPAVELVASELVTNAIEHARTSSDVTIALRGRYVHVAVRDGSPFPPRKTTPASDRSPRGRGLLVVDGLTTAWGSMPCGAGKLVWATIPVDRERAWADAAEDRRRPYGDR